MDIDDLELLLKLLGMYRLAYRVPVGVRIGALIEEVKASVDDIEAEELGAKQEE